MCWRSQYTVYIVHEMCSFSVFSLFVYPYFPFQGHEEGAGAHWVWGAIEGYTPARVHLLKKTKFWESIYLFLFLNPVAVTFWGTLQGQTWMFKFSSHSKQTAHTLQRCYVRKSKRRHSSVAGGEVVTSESRDENMVIIKLPAVGWTVKETRRREDDTRRLGQAWLGFCCWLGADGGPASLSDGTLTAQ